MKGNLILWTVVLTMVLLSGCHTDKDTVFFNERGITYGQKGEYNKAIADFNRAIQIDTNFAMAYSNRGLAYKQKGDIDNARRDFQKAKELGNEDAQKELDSLE